jgi:hypothetical protein
MPENSALCVKAAHGNMGLRAATSGKYLYAVIPAKAAGPPRACAGIAGANAFSISQGRLAAVVSDIPNGPLRPERRNLAAHYAVLKDLIAQGNTILPMAFGTIADNEQVIQRILQSHEDLLIEQLQRVEGKVEMGLKISWNVPNIFEHLIGISSELRDFRDKVFRPGCEPSTDEKINLGRLFERVLSHERTIHTREVLAALRGRCFEIKENKLREERELMNLACLIATNAQAAFDQAVLEAARQFDDTYTFDISGPFPPHNFVDLNLSMQDIRNERVSCS